MKVSKLAFPAVAVAVVVTAAIGLIYRGTATNRKDPITSLSPSNPPSSSPSPTTQCRGKITSIINEHFDDVVKGPPQEEAFSWLIEDISDDECENEAMIIPRYILAVLYFSAGGEDWSDDDDNGNDFDWLESANVCDWLYVRCNDNQQVTELYLFNRNLRGTIPAELGSLTDLEDLDLGGNNLSGSIPGSILELPKLEVLFLYGNDLTGTIPDNFGGSNSLKTIYLSYNFLTGTIPEITGGSLQSIERLALFFNKMSGPVPDSICTLRFSKPNQFRKLYADCDPPDNPQNPCPSGCCTSCALGRGLP